MGTSREGEEGGGCMGERGREEEEEKRGRGGIVSHHYS